MERLKRVIAKPSRYKTTSSEDEEIRRPSKKVPNPSTITDAEIDSDIDDLRRTLENDPSTNMDNNYNIYSQPQESQQQSQQQTYPPQTLTNIPPHTNIEPILITRPTLPISHTYTDNYDNIIYSLDSGTTISTHTHTDGVIFSNNTYGTQYQEKTKSCGPEHNNHQYQGNTRIYRPVHNNRQDQGNMRTYEPVHNNYQDNSERSRTTEKCDRSINLLHERMDDMDAELKRMNTLLQSILKCVQDHRGVPRKSKVLPVSSVEEMDAFENIDENCYSDVVNYLHYIGGFNLKEAVNLCLKEVLKDSLTSSFTWWGREGGPRPLYNTRIIIVIYEAVCKNRHFQKPTRTEFQTQAKEALWAAKERARKKLLGPRARMSNPKDRHFWEDRAEREQEEANEN